MKHTIESIVGKEFNFNFKFNVEDLVWSEDSELNQEKLLSTSSLIEEVHRSAFKVIEEHLDDFETSVVSKINLSHISLTPFNTKVYIKLVPEKINNNNIHFNGEIFDEIDKIAEFSLIRTVVSKKFLKKEKEEKIKKLTNI
jgi:predicted thioesterase